MPRGSQLHIVHLMASPFLGGPERQVLGLARTLTDCRTTFVSFAERGLARPLLNRARDDGYATVELRSNFPHVRTAILEVAGVLRQLQADVVCASGYKPDLIGWRAARAAGLPVVAIAHGWTGATWKVRLYEWLDALAMRFVDCVVCVSEAMALKVRKAGVPGRKIEIIRNALDASPYDDPTPEARGNLLALFPTPPQHLIGAVGRLSPEKGFDVLIRAATLLAPPPGETVGFVVFGDGPLRSALQAQLDAAGLAGRFLLAGFRNDLERYLPGLDIAVSSSHTEGLPVAVLEAQAAGAPVVATRVGGTPEVVVDGRTGLLVPPNDPPALAAALSALLADPDKRRAFGRAGWQRVREEFTFPAQAAQYRRLFARFTNAR